MFERIARIATLMLLVVAACSDDDGGGPVDPIEPDPTMFDLTVHFTGIDQAVPTLPSDGRPLTVFVTENGTDELTAIAMYRDYPYRDWDLKMPKVIPEGSDLRLDVWIDANASNTCDGQPAVDRSWRHQLDGAADNEVDRPINTATQLFLPCPVVGTGLNCWITMTGMTPHVGQQLELRVTETGSGRTIGYYFVDAIENDSFLLIVPNILRSNTEYQVDFYADLNGNNSYDPPPTDHAWRVIQSSNQIGLDLMFDHNTNFTDIQF